VATKNDELTVLCTGLISVNCSRRSCFGGANGVDGVTVVAASWVALFAQQCLVREMFAKKKKNKSRKNYERMKKKKKKKRERERERERERFENKIAVSYLRCAAAKA
jgi:mannitol-specific phosphotransferase system IIBC component